MLKLRPPEYEKVTRATWSVLLNRAIYSIYGRTRPCFPPVSVSRTPDLSFLSKLFIDALLCAANDRRECPDSSCPVLLLSVFLFFLLFPIFFFFLVLLGTFCWAGLLWCLYSREHEPELETNQCNWLGRAWEIPRTRRATQSVSYPECCVLPQGKLIDCNMIDDIARLRFAIIY